MRISILTLFPEMFQGPFDHSIIKRGRQKGIVTIDYVNIRDFATDKHKSVDDRPYGGGLGMILRFDILARALNEAKKQKKPKPYVILLEPKGTVLDQTTVRRLSRYRELIIICGHYEGVDERVRSLVDEEISIGDYILSGGEIAAMVVVDSIVRLLPQVLSKPQATKDESFTGHLLEYPQYTRPKVFKGLEVPNVLLSGNHQSIIKWRQNQAIKNTLQKKRRQLKAQKDLT